MMKKMQKLPKDNFHHYVSEEQSKLLRPNRLIKHFSAHNDSLGT